MLQKFIFYGTVFKKQQKHLRFSPKTFFSLLQHSVFVSFGNENDYWWLATWACYSKFVKPE